MMTDLAIRTARRLADDMTGIILETSGQRRAALIERAHEHARGLFADFTTDERDAAMAIFTKRIASGVVPGAG